MRRLTSPISQFKPKFIIMKKNRDQYDEQMHRILENLWKYDCTIPRNVEQRNHRIRFVMQCAAYRFHCNVFKKPLTLQRALDYAWGR